MRLNLCLVAAMLHHLLVNEKENKLFWLGSQSTRQSQTMHRISRGIAPREGGRVILVAVGINSRLVIGC